MHLFPPGAFHCLRRFHFGFSNNHVGSKVLEMLPKSDSALFLQELKCALFLAFLEEQAISIQRFGSGPPQNDPAAIFAKQFPIHLPKANMLSRQLAPSWIKPSDAVFVTKTAIGMFKNTDQQILTVFQLFTLLIRQSARLQLCVNFLRLRRPRLPIRKFPGLRRRDIFLDFIRRRIDSIPILTCVRDL